MCMCFPSSTFPIIKLIIEEKKGVDLSDQDIVIVQYRNEGEQERENFYSLK